MKAILVVGAGQMGTGIAQVAAQAGFTVQLSDISMEVAQRGIAKIDKALSSQVDKGRLQQGEKEEILGRIGAVAGLDAATDADLVIEAAVENQEVKRQIFARLDQVCKDTAILATNTSSIPITEIAGYTSAPSG